ncbi:hypothetical protein BLS_005631 [Venturia inaequalis]|uniref:Uncharacterized protein n=1 Tax=Venturia inaequalis TaxID=5025 RepID=A0A8H3V3E9_VENIN|nr:hypothetical protein BLS_005631 [Venturia inaequalis]KAE9978221.1 hypothetical protein EG327_007470 [Venturia inaequalis]KAE9981305.1 hypothetical protein EG328_011767 [Venturia inaequalis]RDI89222.1 hypothetical protein Vi05172_g556 [Venturia inaequalis]
MSNSKEKDLAAVEVTVSTDDLEESDEESEESDEESEQSDEESEKGVEQPKDRGWELDILSVEQLPVSEMEMAVDNWAEADRFWNRSRFEQDPKYLEDRTNHFVASSASEWPSLIDLY